MILSEGSTHEQIIVVIMIEATDKEYRVMKMIFDVYDLKWGWTKA